MHWRTGGACLRPMPLQARIPLNNVSNLNI